MEYYGNKQLLELHKTAYFCSQKCPAHLILKTYCRYTIEYFLNIMGHNFPFFLRKKYFKVISVVSGLLLVAIGILIIIG